MSEADFVVPSSPADLKKIQNAAKEISNSLLRIDAERDLIKSIKDAMKEELDVPGSHLLKLAKTYHEQNFSTKQKEARVFELSYEKVFGTGDDFEDQDGDEE